MTPFLRATWLCAALSTIGGGCLAERRPSVGDDGSPAPDGATQDGLDAAGGGGAGDGAAPDGNADAPGSDAQGTDGPGADQQGADTQAPGTDVAHGGCTSDAQCGALIGSPCHSATCDLATGLCAAVALPDGATCVGAPAACMAGGTCKAGTCQASSLSCDDGKLCTLDTCEPATGCVHKAAPGPCSDGNACTVGDKCLDGACVAALPADCTVALDGSGGVAHDACTIHVCDAKLGCLHAAAAAGTACSDGDGCSVGDHCAGKACKGTPLVCVDADKNPCTLGGCNPTTAKCDELPVPPELYVVCDDGNVCTVQDTCAGASCKGKGSAYCDDGKPCTLDSCVAGKGCTAVLAPYAAACPGAVPSQCVAGKCVAQDACDDGLCSLDETPDTCAKDCPVSGGACKADVPVCITACVAAKCAPLADSCAADAGCKALDGCMAGCADAACETACLADKAPASLLDFSLLDQCRVAFCVQDEWIGKKCKGGSPQYALCLDACEGSACPVLAAACKAAPGCLAVRSCVNACPVGDAPCVTACQAKGSAADVQASGNLDTCSQTYCL